MQKSNNHDWLQEMLLRNYDDVDQIVSFQAANIVDVRPIMVGPWPFQSSFWSFKYTVFIQYI